MPEPIIRFDLERVRTRRNFYLTKDDHLNVERTREAIKACLSSNRCQKPDFDDNLMAFLNRIPDYLWFHERLQSGTRRDESLLNRFLAFVEEDFSTRAFRFNPLIKRLGTRLIVPLDSGDFASVKAEIAQSIQEEWKSADLQVKVQWVSKRNHDKAYTIKLGNGSGGRGYTDHRERAIYLFPGVRISTIVHEFGHVLGFRDHYYTVWNPQSCTYHHEFNEEDLMSLSRTGSVTEEAWSVLDQHYPRMRRVSSK